MKHAVDSFLHAIRHFKLIACCYYCCLQKFGDAVNHKANMRGATSGMIAQFHVFLRSTVQELVHTGGTPGSFLIA